MKKTQLLLSLLLFTFFLSCSKKYIDNVTSVDIGIDGKVEKSLIMVIGTEHKAELVSNPLNAKNISVLNNAIFESSNPEVLKVDDDGNINALSPGFSLLQGRVPDQNHLIANCLITVRKSFQPITDLIISTKAFKIATSKTVDLNSFITIEPFDATDTALEFKSSNVGTAAVSEEGILTALNPGVVTITIKTTDNSNIEKSMEVTVVRPNYNNKFDRAEWSVATSHKHQSDGAVKGTPESLIDGDNNSCLSLAKPGRLGTPSDDVVYFVIDMKKVMNFNFFILRHRYPLTTANLRVANASFYGSNNGEEFVPLLLDHVIDVATSTTEVTIDLPMEVEYRYLKMTYNEWASSGNTMQISEFNVGNNLVD